MTNKTYWHFVAKDKRLGYGDGRIVEVGNTYQSNAQPKLCERGLHASKRVIDALRYAPGPIVCKVTLGGIVIHGGDKSVATERTVVAMADATEVLRKFAIIGALDVIYLWGAPEVVVQYLNTGDESIRVTAHEAARKAGDSILASRNPCDFHAAQAASLTTLATQKYVLQAALDTARWGASWEKQNRRLTRMLNNLLNIE